MGSAYSSTSRVIEPATIETTAAMGLHLRAEGGTLVSNLLGRDGWGMHACEEYVQGGG